MKNIWQSFLRKKLKRQNYLVYSNISINCYLLSNTFKKYLRTKRIKAVKQSQTQNQLKHLKFSLEMLKFISFIVVDLLTFEESLIHDSFGDTLSSG